MHQPSLVRQYDFLSQIVNYEDPSLEKLSIYLRHLAPQITRQQLNHEIDLSTVDFDYITHREDRAMIEITLLGTGSPIPDPNRAGASTLVRAGGQVFLVDCGRGMLQRAAGSRRVGGSLSYTEIAS